MIPFAQRRVRVAKSEHIKLFETSVELTGFSDDHLGLQISLYRHVRPNNDHVTA
ncbi:hypothetical protein AALP_AAs58308U000100 [Arabis alpina]|uniref:Uncharacterized protein n=1 Tax=Arabis alpina TaxID=50452 RepID=A0A087G3I3_ARAAL|nr:hypothetical protein AALP_AAs58308U000100 [Arabis alpina]